MLNFVAICKGINTTPGSKSVELWRSGKWKVHSTILLSKGGTCISVQHSSPLISSIKKRSWQGLKDLNPGPLTFEISALSLSYSHGKKIHPL